MSGGLPPGVALTHLRTVTSTNDVVRDLAQSGATGPLWVRAVHQTAGRGRRGRAWLSAPGNLFMSGLLTLDCAPQTAANLSFLTALAVADGLEPYIPKDQITLKWPNDVLVDGKKLCGILLESWPSASALQMAVGIGINLVTLPELEEGDQAITCVQAHMSETALPLEAKNMFEAVVVAFHHWFDIWTQAGFGPIRTAWLARARGVGARVIARLPHEACEGQFEGLGEDGALLLRLASGHQRAITSGEVFFPAFNPR